MVETLIVVAVVCLVVAFVQARRADRHVAVLLQRDVEQRDSRAELVQVFVDEQQRQEMRHEGERRQWRDERGELINAILATKDQPPMLTPGWADGPPEKLYRTEDDEIAEARARVAERIEEQLAIRLPLAPDAAGDVAA